jgi:hypothetical protein
MRAVVVERSATAARTSRTGDSSTHAVNVKHTDWTPGAVVAADGTEGTRAE